MATKIVISKGESRMREKLELMTRIDPSVSGGITQIVQGRRQMGPHEPLEPVCGSGYEEIHEIEPGFCVHVVDSFIEQEWRLTIQCRENNVRFRIAFAGEATYSGARQRVSDESLGCSYLIRPAGDSLTVRFKGGTQYRYCSLNVTQLYLHKALHLGEEDLPSALRQHWGRNEAAMGHFPISKATLALARRLFEIKSTGWRDVEVRAIAYDLLRVVFDNWRGSSQAGRTTMRITPAEREALSLVRELVRSNPSGSYTLASLCQRFRLSRKKLHYGFKRLCGVSIHDFQTELRMQMAMELLQAGRLPIAEIAERSGFSEPTNFTAAFKKHFAVLPRQVRAELPIRQA
ncbi:MAG: AraC family transcriptional regulator [Steroidobacteraceae bacterium]